MSCDQNDLRLFTSHCRRRRRVRCSSDISPVSNLTHTVYCYSFNKLLLQKEELEQKHVHLLQVVESEKTAKWQYTQQCEELSTEIKKLRNEVRGIKINVNHKLRLISNERELFRTHTHGCVSFFNPSFMAHIHVLTINIFISIGVCLVDIVDF